MSKEYNIGNQRMLINRFLDNHPDLSHCQRSEFADDGYTGTNFHRPQFTQMMEIGWQSHSYQAGR